MVLANVDAKRYDLKFVSYLLSYVSERLLSLIAHFMQEL